MSDVVRVCYTKELGLTLKLRTAVFITARTVASGPANDAFFQYCKLDRTKRKFDEFAEGLQTHLGYKVRMGHLLTGEPSTWVTTWHVCSEPAFTKEFSYTVFSINGIEFIALYYYEKISIRRLTRPISSMTEHGRIRISHPSEGILGTYYPWSPSGTRALFGADDAFKNAWESPLIAETFSSKEDFPPRRPVYAQEYGANFVDGLYYNGQRLALDEKLSNRSSKPSFQVKTSANPNFLTGRNQCQQ